MKKKQRTKLKQVCPKLNLKDHSLIWYALDILHAEYDPTDFGGYIEPSRVKVQKDVTKLMQKLREIRALERVKK